jgi:hypothetical protein
MMSVEQSVEWEQARETQVLGENLRKSHFAHHKSHMTWPELEPVLLNAPKISQSFTYIVIFIII